MNYRKIQIHEVSILSKIGRLTFLESHGHSAGPSDIDIYLKKAFNLISLEKEVSDAQNQFYFLENESGIVGYLKFRINNPHHFVPENNSCKLERLYLLKQHTNSGIGTKALWFVIEQAKQYEQSKIYLYVWTENSPAIQFYEKMGFQIAGKEDFKISETHSNPNDILVLNI
jgi:ribosomal protein S18 acetylase RimI-like enzyme